MSQEKIKEILKALQDTDYKTPSPDEADGQGAISEYNTKTNVILPRFISL